MALQGTAQGFTIRKWNGEMIVHQEPKGGMEIFREAPLYDTHRAELHEILLKRAIELGATVSLKPSSLYVTGPEALCWRALAGEARLPGHVVHRDGAWGVG